MPPHVWDPERYARCARFVSDLGAPVVDLLAPRPGQRVLDLGCGDGALTARLAARGCVVVGVDASPAQVAAARARGLDARVMDGQRLAFDGEFDAVFSNAALHWMPDPDAVIDGVWRALRPGGRFAGEMGGAGNVATVREALADGLRRRGIDPARVDPWYFPTAEEYRARLTARGFDVVYAALLPRPTPLPVELSAWLETFAQTYLDAVPPAARAAFLEEVTARTRPRLCPAGRWVVDYVRLRFLAVKPSRGPGPAPPAPPASQGLTRPARPG